MPAPFPKYAFYKRCVKIIIQCNMVTMFHTVGLVSDKSKELTFFIIFSFFVVSFVVDVELLSLDDLLTAALLNALRTALII